MIAGIIKVMQLFGKCECVNQTILAGRSLAGYHRPYLGAGSTGLKSCFFQKSEERFQIVIIDTLDLQCQTGGHSDFAGSEFFCRLSHLDLLIRGEFSVPGNDTDVKYVTVPLILQTAKPLHTLDFFGGKAAFGAGNFYLVEKCATFQYPGVGIAIGL